MYQVLLGLRCQPLLQACMQAPHAGGPHSKGVRISALLHRQQPRLEELRFSRMVSGNMVGHEM